MLDYIPTGLKFHIKERHMKRAKFEQSDTFIKLEILDDILLESFQSCDSALSSHLSLWLPVSIEFFTN